MGTIYAVKREFTDDRLCRRFFPTGLWEGEDPEAADRLANGEIGPVDLAKAPTKSLDEVPYPPSAAEPDLSRRRPR